MFARFGFLRVIIQMDVEIIMAKITMEGRATAATGMTKAMARVGKARGQGRGMVRLVAIVTNEGIIVPWGGATTVDRVGPRVEKVTNTPQTHGMA